MTAQKVSHLQVGEGLALPLDAVTRTTAIVGQRGTGKTSTAVVMVEEAAAAGAQVACVDPTGAWFGLRSSANGKDAGLEVVVFGGHHGDVPLDPGAGAFIARLIIDERLSVVLDLELMTKGKQVQFVAEFAEELYHRNRTALTLVMDEAHRFAPQQLRDPGGFGARCLGAVTDVVTLGRRKGLGAVLISQRPAKINKDVFEQAEILIAHRLMGPNDRKAIAGWLEEVADEHGSGLEAIPKLERGQAVVYAPAYDVGGVFGIRAKRTFDSSATPEIGQQAIEPKGRADIDLAAIEAAMGETIEKAKADDPKALRARIRDLEQQLAARGPSTDDVAAMEQAREALRGARQRVDELEAEAVEAWADAAHAERIVDAVRAALNGTSFTQDDGARASAPSGMEGVQSIAAPARPRAQAPADRGTGQTAMDGGRGRSPGGESDPSSARAATGYGSGSQLPARQLAALKPADLTPARQKVLDALAWFATLGIRDPTRPALAPLAGSKATSGGFKNNLGALRTAGLIDYPGPNRVALTADGSAAARFPERPGSSEELQAAVLATLTPARQAILRVLIDAYPGAVDRRELALGVGVPHTSGGFKNNLGAMRTQGVIDYPQQGAVVAASLLFLEDR